MMFAFVSVLFLVVVVSDVAELMASRKTRRGAPTKPPLWIAHPLHQTWTSPREL